MNSRPGNSRPGNSLSGREAIRIVLAAQGLSRPPRPGKKTRTHLAQVIDRIGLLQMDSVNVLTRAHYMPLFSRLAGYDPTLLEAAAWDPKRRTLFEYWGHEASLLPLTLQPYMRWRMARAERFEGIYDGIARAARDKPGFIDSVYREVEQRGPVAASELDRANHKGSSWWGWTDTKLALEYLFWAGRVATATRRGFERVYDLAERVIPAVIQAIPTPAEADAQRHLIGVAARALGIATEADLRDYFRLDVADAKVRIIELVEDKRLIPVTVNGWRQLAYLEPDAATAQKGTASALISPFDPLIWERDRTERLFGFRYRLEIYTPAPKREYGYYVLPFLSGETLAARVDLKAERKAGSLRVAAAHLEPGADAGRTAQELSGKLRAMAAWLGLECVVIEQRGNLAPALIAAHAAD
ncbi:MAG: winged helix-turn-helix protein [Rhodospirillales bacterium]|nr:winged helix-turn-helix protein [Rhodospirillales bacterium]